MRAPEKKVGSDVNQEILQRSKASSQTLNITKSNLCKQSPAGQQWLRRRKQPTYSLLRENQSTLFADQSSSLDQTDKQITDTHNMSEKISSEPTMR